MEDKNKALKQFVIFLVIVVAVTLIVLKLLLMNGE
jgi:hypothetical protein